MDVLNIANSDYKEMELFSGHVALCSEQEIIREITAEIFVIPTFYLIDSWRNHFLSLIIHGCLI
jgi:hypothetical protein